jgi:hypothetical protein
MSNANRNYFQLPFGVRVAGSDPIDGDRGIVYSITERDTLITNRRAHQGLQVWVDTTDNTRGLYILDELVVGDSINSKWIRFTSGGTGNGTADGYVNSVAYDTSNDDLQFSGQDNGFSGVVDISPVREIKADITATTTVGGVPEGETFSGGADNFENILRKILTPYVKSTISNLNINYSNFTPLVGEVVSFNTATWNIGVDSDGNLPTQQIFNEYFGSIAQGTTTATLTSIQNISSINVGAVSPNIQLTSKSGDNTTLLGTLSSTLYYYDEFYFGTTNSDNIIDFTNNFSPTSTTNEVNVKSKYKTYNANGYLNKQFNGDIDTNSNVNYTFFCLPKSITQPSELILDGATGVIKAFTKHENISLSNGVTNRMYTVYISNTTQAYNNTQVLTIKL